MGVITVLNYWSGLQGDRICQGRGHTGIVVTVQSAKHEPSRGVWGHAYLPTPGNFGEKCTLGLNLVAVLLKFH